VLQSVAYSVLFISGAIDALLLRHPTKMRQIALEAPRLLRWIVSGLVSGVEAGYFNLALREKRIISSSVSPFLGGMVTKGTGYH